MCVFKDYRHSDLKLFAGFVIAALTISVLTARKESIVTMIMGITYDVQGILVLYAKLSIHFPKK